jgi:hypothetical protein
VRAARCYLLFAWLRLFRANATSLACTRKRGADHVEIPSDLAG